VNYTVDSLGKSNIDFLLKMNENDSDSIDSASSGLPFVDLKKVKVKNTFVYYNDDSLKIAAKLFFPELDFKGKLANEKFEGIAAGDVQFTNCSFGTTNLNRMEEAAVNFKIAYEADTLKITKLKAKTEGANFEITGKMAFSDTLFTDLTI